MTSEIVYKEAHVEVHASGQASQWDLLKLIYQLQKNDPKKKTPDLWVLAEDFELSLYSFPPVIQGVLALIMRNKIKRGAKSAILAVNQFQKAKANIYCEEAASLPFPLQAFTNRDEAMEWLLSEQAPSSDRSDKPVSPSKTTIR